MDWCFRRDSYIRKTPDKQEWCVHAESGKNMGCYPSHKGAADRLRDIEFFKHKAALASGRKTTATLKPRISESDLAAKWGLPLEQIRAELSKGIKVEMEHTDDPEEAATIASHHVAEMADYYTKLAVMESPAETKQAHLRAISGDSTYNWSPMDYPVDYTEAVPVPETDQNYTEMGRRETDDHYDFQGSSKDREKKSRDTLLRQDMPYAEHDTTGWTDSSQPSSSPHGGSWDSPTSSAPEGSFPYPSVSDGSGSEVYSHKSPANHSTMQNNNTDRAYFASAADIYGSVSATNEVAWTMQASGSFGDFLDHSAAVILNCRRGGLSRAATASAVHKLYATLFLKSEWMDKVLNRFLDRAYGTSARVKTPYESIESGIEAYITKMASTGHRAHETEEGILAEYSSWVENYPELRVVIADKMDSAYGAKLAVDTDITKFKKITLIGSGRSGVVLDVASSTPSATEISVLWLDNDSVEDITVKDDEVVVREPSASELRKATETSDPPIAHTAHVIIAHNAGDRYLYSFVSTYKELPVTYGEFRRWCANTGLDMAATYALESSALRLNYVTMPETVVVFSDKKVYVASDNSAAEVVDVDPSKPPESIKTKEGKELKLKS